jgi:hypothetical protein
MQSLAKPALPERKPSAVGTGPQPDDLEDVKRVSHFIWYTQRFLLIRSYVEWDSPVNLL